MREILGFSEILYANSTPPTFFFLHHHHSNNYLRKKSIVKIKHNWKKAICKSKQILEVKEIQIAQ